MGSFGRSDRYYGGDGDDEINAHEGGAPTGTDTIEGQGDDDTIYTVDGVKDSIDCGDGIDDVTFDDGIDVVANCESQSPQPLVLGRVLEIIR
jgi:hypothetical protein